MDTRSVAAVAYTCPMHPAVRLPGPGKCPHCGMDLMPEGTRLALVRHMLGNPLHVLAMVALMIAVMAIVMMVIRAAE